MEKEFGLNPWAKLFGYESIKVRGGFPENMEKKCNYEKVYIIKKITSPYSVRFQTEDEFTKEFRITTDMLKPANPSKTTITITSDNEKFVNASLFEGEERIKNTYARCHPEDKFDLYTGAEIALKRLFGVEEKKTMPLKDTPLTPPPEGAHPRIIYQYYFYSSKGEKVMLESVGGKSTSFVDAMGEPCCIGDVVEVFDKQMCSLGYYFVLGENASDAYIGKFSPNLYRTRLQNYIFLKRAEYDADDETLATILGPMKTAHGIQRIVCLTNTFHFPDSRL